MTCLVEIKSELQIIAKSLAALENQVDETNELVSQALPKLQTQVDLSGAALTALADEFVPLGRRAAALLDGSPSKKLRAAMGAGEYGRSRT